MKKKIIIFINENLFENSLDDIENVIVFKFNNNVFPDILIGEDVINIDRNVLVNHVMLNWPCNISCEEVEYYLKKIFLELKINEYLIISDYKIFIIYKIIQKLLNIQLKIQINFDVEKTHMIYLSYIKNLI